MYQEHAPKITEYAAGSSVGFSHAAVFTALTIRQPFEAVQSQMRDVYWFGLGSSYLWGWKADTYAHVVRRCEQLHRDLSNAISLGDSERAMDTALTIPGLGLAKAGFLCQLLGDQRAACLDSHNLKLHGLAEIRYRKEMTPRTRAARVTSYLEQCDALGGPSVLWDSWCNHIATLRPKHWRDGHHVSQYHVETILG